MIPRINSIKPLPDYKLAVAFDDGKRVTYDVKEDMNLPGYGLLREVNGLFQQVQLDQSRTCRAMRYMNTGWNRRRLDASACFITGGHIPGQILPHIKRTPIPERISQRYKKEEASGDVSFYTQYRMEYLIIMRFVGEPCCHMTAIGKAFIL